MACSSLSLPPTSTSKCCIHFIIIIIVIIVNTYKILSFRKRRKGEQLEKSEANKIQNNDAFEKEDTSFEEGKENIVKDEGSEKEEQAFETDQQQSGTSG